MLYDPINIELSEPLHYGTSNAEGNVAQSSKILVCNPPTSEEGKLTAYLKQNFWRNMKSAQPQDLSAALDTQDKPSPDADGSIPPEAVIVSLYMGNIDAYEYQMKFKQLICGTTGISTLVTINGEVPFTKTHYKKLDHEDVDLFMGHYISFFLVNSLTKILNPSSPK